jgi:hypothetical protein
MKRWRKLLLLIPAVLILVYLLIWGPKEQSQEHPPPLQTVWYADTTIERVKGEGKNAWSLEPASGRCVLVLETWELNPINPKGPGFRDRIYIGLPEVTEPAKIDLAKTPGVVTAFLSNRHSGLVLKPGTVQGTLDITSVSGDSLVVSYRVRLILQDRGTPTHEQGITQAAKDRTFTRLRPPAAGTVVGETVQQNKSD